jgi:hypothetical protein
MHLIVVIIYNLFTCLFAKWWEFFLLLPHGLLKWCIFSLALYLELIICHDSSVIDLFLFSWLDKKNKKVDEFSFIITGKTNWG